MQFYLDWLRIYWPWLVWPALTAILNLASRVDTATWERWGATKPRLQAFLRLLRAVGIDPHTAIVALRDIVVARGAALAPRPASLRDAQSPPTVRDLPPPPGATFGMGIIGNVDPAAAPQWWNAPGAMPPVSVDVSFPGRPPSATDTPPETPAAKAEEKKP